ncbi:MAG: DMT family transporter [Firmicutes bacterium]|nr:DMT family transporter [Bacillota bacterium]
MSKKMQGNLLLLLTALIWGCAFVAQKEGMNQIGPFAFNGIRTIIGAFSLIPLILFLSKNGSATATSDNRTLIKGGVLCGIVLFVASNLQQIGLAYTSVGHSGFVTALYVVLVPICGLFIRKRVRGLTWLCVIASAIGLYLLCIPSSGFGDINKGDLYTLGCALFFTFHILLIDHFSPKVDGVKLSCIQFFVCSILSMLIMVPADTAMGFAAPTFANVLNAAIPLLYSGVLSSGAGYTLQIIAQKNTDPTVASMIMCLESVFALLAGMVILGEMLSVKEVFGCALMFAAIIVSQLPDRSQK